MEEAIKKAEVLIEALPYIIKFRGKIIVIKYGGSILGEERIRRGVLEDIVFLNSIGVKPILVHGGGPNISERMKQEGKKTDFVEGMRVTDKETLKIVEEELRKLNRIIVEEIRQLGTEAESLSGKDNELVQAEKKKAKVDLGFVGEVVGINSKIILEVLEKKVIPVIMPMGIDKLGRVFNINADEVASELAGTLLAEKLVLLTNVKGIFRIPEDPQSLLSTLSIKDAEALIRDKVIQEGMIPKVNACIKALERGVKKAHIIDARISHALLLEIFTDKGIGTEIIK